MKGNAMNRAHLRLIAASLAGIAALCICGAAGGPAPQSSELEQIKQELASLRQRVESLEQRLKDQRIIIPRNDGKGPIITEPWLRPRQVPKGWKRFEFNGMDFYVIPIGETSRPTKKPDK
jgi:hypothetical protein